MSRARRPDQPTAITAELLRGWPLPVPDEEGDKRARGLVVCVGGSEELPGAILLAATAALRAGAGTVRMGVPRTIQLAVGVALPEALVFAPPTATQIAARSTEASAVLIGPGQPATPGHARLLTSLLPRLPAAATVLLDAHALDAVPQVGDAIRAARTILTPHAGEMARLLNIDRDTVEAQPLATARRAARDLRAVVVLKGAHTRVVGPDAEAYCYEEGDVGLATSGSGDTLAGIIAGLAARGAEPTQAAVWGVYLHGAAGNRLRQTVGRLGYLARELLDQVPPLIAELDHTASAGSGNSTPSAP